MWDSEFVLFDPNTEAGHSLLRLRQRIKWSCNKSGHQTTGGAANAEHRGGVVDEAATAATTTIRRRGGVMNSNACCPTLLRICSWMYCCRAAAFQRQIRRGKSVSMQDPLCLCNDSDAILLTNWRRLHFDGSIDDLGAAYRCAALAVLMAKTMTKWKRAAIATAMTTMMRAFVGLLQQRRIVVGGIHMTTQSWRAGWCRIPNGIDEVVAH